MQDVFLRALTRVGTARKCWPLETWMLSIMITEGRRRGVVARPVLEAPTGELARETGDGDPRTAAVRSVLVTLPRRQREVAFLRYFADLDEATIAARLGIHRGTVSATLHRVRERARQAIADEGIATPAA
jgi:RNA polymerase sigma factor (sigma-70 family)